jgi:ATP-dependent DNA helicase RecG
MDLSVLGCTTAKTNQLRKKNINTVEELVEWLPRRYYDFRTPKKCSEVNDGDTVSIIGTVVNVSQKTTSTGRPMVTFNMKDDDGHHFYVYYFNSNYMTRMLGAGNRVIFCGKAKVTLEGSNRFVAFINPMRYSRNIPDLEKIVPIYRKIPGMSTEYFDKTMEKALYLVKKDDYLEPNVLDKSGLLRTADTIEQIHHPTSPDNIQKAQRRLIFDDLFFFNLILKERSITENPKSLITFARHDRVNAYLKSLPFALTADQKKAIQFMYQKGKAGERIHCLVNGDVGYGKTEIAKVMALMAVDNGAQTVVMAPTTVLAHQHFHDFTASFQNLNVKVALLTSELKKSERKKLLAEIKEGAVNIVIGTHSCLSDEVIYSRLGLIVVDEEHRFGVTQREKLNVQMQNGVHSISMSATPIPRTLALAMYGEDTDILDIKTAPAFKKDVITSIVQSDRDVAIQVYKELKKGHQAYIVCPLIEESEEDDDEDAAAAPKVDSVEETYAKFAPLFEKYGFKTAVATGKMKDDETAQVLSDFVQNKTQILIATTIIEVGVNVPNATVMVIKNADHYGLAQMHQLRGRVGRGKDQGYCLLQYAYQDEKVMERLNLLCRSSDGFEIAQEDMRLRGVGNLIGTTQTGENKYFSLVMTYPKLNRSIRNLVNEVYEEPLRVEYYRDRLKDRMEKEGCEPE